MSIFGFSTEPSSGGNFLPVVKFNCPSGRMFRVDRSNNGNGYESAEIEITDTFKAIMDLENVETGWINFPMGGTPSFVMVPMATQRPPRPTPEHKDGVRVMLKLAKSCSDENPIREMAGNAKAFLAGMEELVSAYMAERDKHPGKLPVVTMEKPILRKSAGNSKGNYQPKFRIVDWAPRGDLVFQPKNPPQTAATTAASPPSTGSTPVAPPVPQPAASASDFG